MKSTIFNKRKFKKGLTLIEVILSLAILAMIIIPFMNMFLHSTITNRKSEEIIDATYVAQSIIEELYKESSRGSKDIPGNESRWHTDLTGKEYWAVQEIKNEGILVRAIIKIYADNSEKDLEAQMETYFLWK